MSWGSQAASFRGEGLLRAGHPKKARGSTFLTQRPTASPALAISPSFISALSTST